MSLPFEELNWICRHSVLNPSPDSSQYPVHFNWMRVLNTAISNGVAPLIYHSLRTAGNHADIPPAIYAQFKQEYQSSSDGNLHHEITLSRLVSELRIKGTEVILLNGLSIAHNHYPEPALRPYRDIHLFIRPRDYKHICDVMRSWNFAVEFPGKEEMPFLQGRQKFFQQSSNTTIQIRWEPLNNIHLRSTTGTSLNAYKLWHNLDRTDIKGVSVNVLPADRLFSYLCMHVACNQQFRRLLSLCDLHMMLSGPHSREIHEIVLPGLVRDPGTRTAVHYCLKMLRSLLGTSGIDKTISMSEPHRFSTRTLCNFLRPSDTLNSDSRPAQLRRKLFFKGIKMRDTDNNPDKLRVALVSLNIPRNYNLAIEYLRLYALETSRLDGKVSIRLLNIDRTARRLYILLRILLFRPRVVGFSCYVWNIQRTLAVARLVKQVWPKAYIVFGGQEVTFSNVDFLAKYPFIDVVVEGEGEETFSDLLTHMVNNRDFSLADVPGIAYRKDSVIQKNAPRPLIKELDTIGSPYLTGRIPPQDEYRLGMMLEICRGCRYRCAFCFEGKKYRTVRSFPIDRIDHEVNVLFAHGKRRFHIMDPIIGNHDAGTTVALKQIFQRLQDIDHCDVSVELFAELLNEETLDWLNSFTIFDVGLQSIHPPVLRNIRRAFQQEKFIKGVELLKQLDRQVNLYLIMGLPGETLFTYLKGIRFAISLDPSYLFLNPLCVLNGTELRDRAEEFGLIYGPEPPYNIIETPDMTQDEIRRMRVFSEMLIAEHNLKINW